MSEFTNHGLHSYSPVMSEDFQNELQAINAIYGDDTLVETQEKDVFLLSLSGPCDLCISIRLSFPSTYPENPPDITGSEGLGKGVPKGLASKILQIAHRILDETFQPGFVCIFGLIEALQTCLETEMAEASTQSDEHNPAEAQPLKFSQPDHSMILERSPSWTLSQPFHEKKSTFVAHVSHVQSVAAVRNAIAHLLATNKKCAKATHNITAYSIRDAQNPAIILQDCDDDGEAAAVSIPFSETRQRYWAMLNTF